MFQLKVPDQPGKRIIMTLGGMLLLGFGIGLLVTANYGTDPFSVLMLGLASKTSLRYGTFAVLANLILLIGMFIINREKIGIGTLINLFLLGYIIQFARDTLADLIPDPSVPLRITLLIAGIGIVCLACSLYFVADLGISTYDVYAVTLGERTKVPFRFWRILTDSICVLIGWLCGETVGVGTLITALFMGPLISFFVKHVSEPLLFGQSQVQRGIAK